MCGPIGTLRNCLQCTADQCVLTFEALGGFFGTYPATHFPFSSFNDYQYEPQIRFTISQVAMALITFVKLLVTVWVHYDN